MKLSIILFDGFTALDVVGGYEVLARIPGMETEFVAEKDGKYVTGAGVSASIDTAIYLANELAGEVVARALTLGTEYYPAPPFPERSPAEVPAEIQEIVRAFDAGAAA